MAIVSWPYRLYDVSSRYILATRLLPTSGGRWACLVSVRVGEKSGGDYTGHVTVDSASLLVGVTAGFDHELDASVAVAYRCRRDVTRDDDVVRSSSNVTSSSCRARVVIRDVNDRSPHIRFINATTAKYDRLAPIEITASVCKRGRSVSFQPNLFVRGFV